MLPFSKRYQIAIGHLSPQYSYLYYLLNSILLRSPFFLKHSHPAGLCTIFFRFSFFSFLFQSSLPPVDIKYWHSSNLRARPSLFILFYIFLINLFPNYYLYIKIIPALTISQHCHLQGCHSSNSFKIPDFIVSFFSSSSVLCFSNDHHHSSI